jgi:hypothetical protein
MAELLHEVSITEDHGWRNIAITLMTPVVSVIACFRQS